MRTRLPTSSRARARFRGWPRSLRPVNEVDAAELGEFAWRVLLDRGAAADAVATAVSGAPAGLEEISALAQVCRGVPESSLAGLVAEPLDGGGSGTAGSPAAGRLAAGRLAAGRLAAGSLARSVAAELDGANTSLTRRQREILALRELFGLSYEEISDVMGLEAEAVCAMLARARLAFRAKLRGVVRGEEGCVDHDQALQVLARGLDREPVPEDDVNWLFAHIAGCESCQRAHSEMHEASVVYRAWVWR